MEAMLVFGVVRLTCNAIFYGAEETCRAPLACEQAIFEGESGAARREECREAAGSQAVRAQDGEKAGPKTGEETAGRPQALIGKDVNEAIAGGQALRSEGRICFDAENT